MLDAIHNLALRARQYGISQITTIVTDSGTVVDLFCQTDADYPAVANMLLNKGASVVLRTYKARLDNKYWLRTVLSLDSVQFVVLGPQHAVTQEAA